MLLKSSLLLFLVTLLSCGPNLKEAGMDTDKLNDQIQSMKIKRVTSKELYTWINLKSPQLADTLGYELKKIFPKSSDIDLKKYCAEYNTALKKALTKNYHADIQLIYLDAIPKGSKGKLLQVWEAYLYNIKESTPLEANLQKEDDNYYYTRQANISNDAPVFWLITFTKQNAIKSFNKKELK